MKRRKANWIGNIWYGDCIVEHVIQGKIEVRIEVKGRRGKRCTQLVDDLKEKK
jgi:hypothetical protein